MIYAPLDSAGAGRGEERAPQALEDAGLLDAAAVDSVADTRALIRDSRRDPETGVIGVGELRRASETVAAAVSEALAAGRLPLVVGGDCSILLGIRAALPGDAGLWFVDGHADFLDGATSPSGEVADMELGIWPTAIPIATPMGRTRSGSSAAWRGSSRPAPRPGERRPPASRGGSAPTRGRPPT